MCERAHSDVPVPQRRRLGVRAQSMTMTTSGSDGDDGDGGERQAGADAGALVIRPQSSVCVSRRRPATALPAPDAISGAFVRCVPHARVPTSNSAIREVSVLHDRIHTIMEALLHKPRYRTRWTALVALDGALRECCRSRKPLDIVLSAVASADATCGGLAIARGAFASAIVVNYQVQPGAPWTPDVHSLSCGVFVALDVLSCAGDARPHIDARDVLLAMCFLAKFFDKPAARLAAGFAAFAGPGDGSGGAERWLPPADVARVLLATSCCEDDAVAVMFAAAGVSMDVREASRRRSLATVLAPEEEEPPRALAVAPGAAAAAAAAAAALPPPTILNMVGRGKPPADAPPRVTLAAFTAYLAARPALVAVLHTQFMGLLSPGQRAALVGARAEAAEAAMVVGLRAVEARCAALATAEAAVARAAAEGAARKRFAEVRGAGVRDACLRLSVARAS